MTLTLSLPPDSLFIIPYKQIVQIILAHQMLNIITNQRRSCIERLHFLTSRSAKIMTMPMMVTPLSSPTPYDCGDHAHGWATEGRR